MSLPTYLAPTASTRSKHHSKRTSAIESVKRTSTTIKDLVNAATRNHHHGQQQTQTKRQPISSSHTPTTKTTTTTTTPPARSSLESPPAPAPKQKQQQPSPSSPTSATSSPSHQPPPPSSFRLKAASPDDPKRTPSTTRTASSKTAKALGPSNAADAVRRMLSTTESPLVVTCVPARPITKLKYTKLAQKPTYSSSFLPSQPSSAISDSTTSLASTLTLPSSSSRPGTPATTITTTTSSAPSPPPVPPLPTNAAPTQPPAPPAPTRRTSSLFKPTAASISKATAPRRLSKLGTTITTPPVTKPAPQRGALPWLPPIDTTLHRTRASIESPQPCRTSTDRPRPSLERPRPSLERPRPSPATDGHRPLGGRPSLDQQQHKRGKPSTSSPFSSSGTFSHSPSPYSGSSNGGSSPSSGSQSGPELARPKGPPQSPRSKIQALKSLFTRRRTDSGSVVSATTTTTTSTSTSNTTASRHERGGSGSGSGVNRRTPSPGAAIALSFGSGTGVALNKPKPLRGEGRKPPERRSEEQQQVAPAVVLDPDVDVDFRPPALPTLRMVHENIPVHGCSILDAPYPYSYEEFILQAEQHTHDLLSTVMGTRVPLFVSPENVSRAREVLDLGCGRGMWMTEAAKEWKNARFVGIDLIDMFPSAEHLRKRCGLTDAQAARVHFMQGNFLKGLPFENDRFDYVRMAFLEHAISELKWPAVLAEVMRVLRPGGTLEIITEELIFPNHADWDVYAVQKHLEDDFVRLLRRRRLLGATERMGELLFDAGCKTVERHPPLVVCKAPTLDSRKRSGSYGRRASRPPDSPLWSSTASAPPTGYMTARACNMPALVIEPELFIPLPEDVLCVYAAHASMMLNAARHATFAQAFDDDDEGARWRAYTARVFEYERLMRRRLGIREKQFEPDEDDDDYDEARRQVLFRPTSPPAPASPDAPTPGRWRWRAEPGGDDADRPLKIRSFRAWSSTKPLGPVIIPWLGAGPTV